MHPKHSGAVAPDRFVLFRVLLSQVPKMGDDKLCEIHADSFHVITFVDVGIIRTGESHNGRSSRLKGQGVSRLPAQEFPDECRIHHVHKGFRLRSEGSVCLDSLTGFEDRPRRLLTEKNVLGIICFDVEAK